MSSYVEPLQPRDAQRERASILGHVGKRVRAREQKDVRARGARATRGARRWRASKNELAREQGARTHKRARARAGVLRRSHTNTPRGQISSHKLTARANKLT